MFDITAQKNRLDEIWKTEDKWDFIWEMYMYVSDKVCSKESLEQMTDAELTLFICYELDAEVNNGGFSQYYFNTDGIFCLAAPHVFREVGASRMADVIERANQSFSEPLSPASEIRRTQLDELDEEEVIEKLNERDREYYETGDDLGSLLYDFCHSHRDEFK